MSGKAVAAADAALGPPQPRDEGWPALTVAGKTDANRKMAAVTWQGKRKVSVSQVAVPRVTDPQDAVIRVTSTAICGSDLHLFEHAMPSMKAGDVLGHEFIGVVEEVGAEVATLKPGDRVVCCFDICGCGCKCFYCSRGLFSCCAASNPSSVQEMMYGQATAGLFGYSHLTGGWQGGQAEYVRVPVADHNTLKVPPSMADDRALFLSDILPTAWHGCELGEVVQGDVVAIWGAGPVGILIAHCAQYRGAKRVILIDSLPHRLSFAASKLPGVETIDRTAHNPLKALKDLLAAEPAGAPDVVIDAVGMHYATSLVHKVQVALQLESDTPEAVNECIRAVRKGGRISIIGAYAGLCNGFALGPLMEKSLTLRGGQTPVQKYWKELMGKVESGELDPTMVITHRMPLDQAPEGYRIFNNKEGGCVKVILKTGAEVPAEAPAGAPVAAGGVASGAPGAATAGKVEGGAAGEEK